MKRAFHQFGLALSSNTKAIEFVFKNKLYLYFIFPFFINILVIYSGISIVSEFSDYMFSLIKFENLDFWGAEILIATIKILVWILSVSFLVLFGGYFTLIILSPILSILSEKTEKIYSNKEYPFNIKQILKDAIRGVILAFRNLIKEISWIIIIYIASIFLGFIPIIGWILAIFGQFFLFLLASYYYGFSFMDYTNERRKLSYRQSIRFIRHNKGMAVGNGFVFSLCLMIPIIGGFVASFFAIIAVVSATLTMLDNQLTINN